MSSRTGTVVQMLVFLVFCYIKIQNYKMKVTYRPFLAVHNISFLQHLLFVFIPACVSVKELYFHKDLEQTNTKQKSNAKSFKIMLTLAYGRMPTKPELMILGRTAYFINGFKNISRFTAVIL